MSLGNLNSVATVEESLPLQIGDKTKVIEKRKCKQPQSIQGWLHRRIHILTWIKNYNRSKALSDLIAGVTLGLTIIPQSIAYAALAGLSSQYGLFSSFVGAFAYVIFGSIPQVSIGPTSLMALLTLKYTKNLPVEFTIVLTFLVGVVELLMGIFDTGFLLNFISFPVTSAFITGTSVVIIQTQCKNLLGIRSKNISTHPSSFLKQVTLGDCFLGITSIGILLLLRQLSKLKFETSDRSRTILKKSLWYISISRNAIVVFSSSCLAFYISMNYGRNAVPFNLSKIENSTMRIQLPPFVIKYENISYSFLDICSKLGSGIIVLPIVAVLANVAIAKAFVKDSKVDASQEMLTLGICNIAGSFFSAMPTCGALTRSAVSNASGVKTPFAGIYAGGLALLALQTLTPYFVYIPKSSLSAVLMCAVFFMIDFNTPKDLWNKNKTEFLNWITVFTICVAYNVEAGLVFGILFNFIFLAMRVASPTVDIIKKDLNGYQFLHVTPCTEVYYSGADYFRDIIKSKSDEYYNMYPIVINCENLGKNDYTILLALKTIIKELEERKIQVYFQHVNLTTKSYLCETENNAIFFNNDFELEKLISRKLKHEE